MTPASRPPSQSFFQISPTEGSHGRRYVLIERPLLDLSLIFSPDEAEAIAAELMEAAHAARQPAREETP